MAILFNKAECSLLATALNNAKRASFTPSQQAQLPKLCRRLAGFLIDGQTSNNTGPKQKPLIGFAKIRAKDAEWQQRKAELLASIEPPVAVDIADKLPPLIVPDCEAIYATLRGKHK